MKNALWLVVGIGLGFVAAHYAARTPQGKQFFDEVDAKAHEFAAAILDGYREREAELSDVAGDIAGRIR